MAGRLYRIALVACFALSGALDASGQDCRNGRFSTDVRVPFPAADATPLIISIEDGQIALEPFCPPIPAKVRKTRRGFKAKARWKTCGGIARGVRLRLRSNRGCDDMRGAIRVRKPRAKLRFAGTRIDRCKFPFPCPPGTLPGDSNGDGCDDVCHCLVVVDCAPSSIPVDTNGNGCVNTCVCPEILCSPSSIPIDTNGDGCNNACICPEIDCPPFSLPVDTNGDGCQDACQPPNSVCRDDSDCWDPALFCGKDLGDCGGIGICRPRTEFCTRQYDPVCGCDGRTYSNACGAGSAGVNIAQDAACLPTR